MNERKEKGKEREQAPTDVQTSCHLHVDSAFLMFFMSKSLCKAVSRHFRRGDILNPDDPVLNCFTDEVVMEIDVFRMRVRYRVLWKCNCTLIIGVQFDRLIGFSVQVTEFCKKSYDWL